MSQIYVFNLDNVLIELKEKITQEHADILNKLKNKYNIAICTGYSLNTVLEAMDNLIYFNYYFCENGNVYYKNNSDDSIDLKCERSHNIQNNRYFNNCKPVIQEFLNFISKVDYPISGTFVDLRTGLYFLSCIGKQSSKKEILDFIKLDKEKNIRENLIIKLRSKTLGNNLDIVMGETNGFYLYPFDHDKIQIVDLLNYQGYNMIHLFEDNYYDKPHLLSMRSLQLYKINDYKETYDILNKLI